VSGCHRFRSHICTLQRRKPAIDVVYDAASTSLLPSLQTLGTYIKSAAFCRNSMQIGCDARHRQSGKDYNVSMEFRTSAPKTTGLICLGVLMVAASYFAATHARGYEMLVPWFCVSVFSVGVLLGCVQLFRREPSLVMNNEGISGRQVGSQPFKWSDIASVSVEQVRRQKFLCLWLRDQDAYVAALPAARQLMAKASIALGFPATSLSFTALEPGVQQALEYALKHVPAGRNRGEGP
jgi:hypothetical protein